MISLTGVGEPSEIDSYVSSTVGTLARDLVREDEAMVARDSAFR